MGIDRENPGEKQKGFRRRGDLALASGLAVKAAEAMDGALPTRPRKRRRSSDALAVAEAQELSKAWFFIRSKNRKTEKKKIDGKKQAEEVDDDSVSSNRVLKLKEIIRVLEELNSSLHGRRATKEEGGDGSANITFGRLCNLIYSHVHGYIFLHYLEQHKYKDYGSKDEELLPLFQAFPFHKGDILPDPMELQELLENVQWLVPLYLADLLTCRSSFAVRKNADDPKAAQPMLDNLHYRNTFKEDGQRLLDVLNTLEVLGHSRAYAPPTPGEEMQCYKDIRKCITSSLAVAAAKYELDEAAGYNPKSRGNIDGIALLDTEAYGPWGLCYGPPGYQFAIAFDLIPEYRSLLDEYKQGIPHVFFPQNNTEQHQATDPRAPVKDNAVSDNQNAISPIQLIKWEPKKSHSSTQKPAVQTRLGCLKIITSKLGTITSFNEKPPTRKEIRLCALISEHISSSLWLSSTVEHNEIIVEGSCEVDVADIVSGNYGLSAVGSGQPQPEGDNIRERCLDEIASYLRACKLSCLAELPTREEVEQYDELVTVFGPVVRELLGPEPMKEDPMKEDDETKSGLRQKLFCIYKSVQGFINDLEAELHEILSTIHGLTCLEGVVSFNDAIGMSTEDNKEMMKKLKEFFGSPLPGRMDLLDQALLSVSELNNMGNGIFIKLDHAIKAICAAWQMDRDFNMVEKEVDNALNVMVSEKPFRF